MVKKKKEVEENLVAKALAKAKELERLVPHGKKKIFAEYKESLEKAGELYKLLSPAWYLGKGKRKKA